MRQDILDEVYRIHYNDVYLYALSLTRNSSDAEELAAESFCRALLSLGDDAPSVKYWLLRVCRNLFIDEARRRKRLAAQPIEEMELPFDAALPERAIQSEEKERLYRCLLQLPENYREVLTMFYFLEYSVAEIAGIIGKTPGNVKVLLSRGRARLATIWEGTA